MVVWWRELGDVENECTSHNFSLFAIILPKLSNLVDTGLSSDKNNFAQLLRHGAHVCLLYVKYLMVQEVYKPFGDKRFYVDSFQARLYNLDFVGNQRLKQNIVWRKSTWLVLQKLNSFKQHDHIITKLIIVSA